MHSPLGCAGPDKSIAKPKFRLIRCGWRIKTYRQPKISAIGLDRQDMRVGVCYYCISRQPTSSADKLRDPRMDYNRDRDRKRNLLSPPSLASASPALSERHMPEIRTPNPARPSVRSPSRCTAASISLQFPVFKRLGPSPSWHRRPACIDSVESVRGKMNRKSALRGRRGMMHGAVAVLHGCSVQRYIFFTVTIPSHPNASADYTGIGLSMYPRAFAETSKLAQCRPSRSSIMREGFQNNIAMATGTCKLLRPSREACGGPSRHLSTSLQLRGRQPGERQMPGFFCPFLSYCFICILTRSFTGIDRPLTVRLFINRIPCDDIVCPAERDSIIS